MGELDPVFAVRGSVGLTEASRTAALRFVELRFGGADEFAAGLETKGHRTIGSAVRRFDAVGRRIQAVLGGSEIDGEAGVADVVHQRFLYDTNGGGWELRAPGREYTGGPDEWEMVPSDDVVDVGEPMWLLGL